MFIGLKILIGEQLIIQWHLFKTWHLIEKLQQDICQICVFIYCFASNKYLALFCLPLGSFTCKNFISFAKEGIFLIRNVACSMFIGFKILIVEQLVIQWRLFKTRLLLEKLQEDVCQICLFIYCFVANKYLALFCLPLGSFTWKNFISFAKVGIFLIRNVACAMLIGWKILIGEQLTIQWRLFKTWLLLEKIHQDIRQICVFIFNINSTLEGDTFTLLRTLI